MDPKLVIEGKEGEAKYLIVKPNYDDLTLDVTGEIIDARKTTLFGFRKEFDLSPLGYVSQEQIKKSKKEVAKEGLEKAVEHLIDFGKQKGADFVLTEILYNVDCGTYWRIEVAAQPVLLYEKKD